jgi:hypothetical protein
MALAVLVTATTAIAAAAPTPASAYTAPPNATAGAIYDVVGTDGGVYWRWGPWNSAHQAIAGYGEYDGYQVTLDCWAFGEPSGPYGNRLWYFAEQWYPQPAVGDGRGWINDHYLDTPDTAANPQPIGPQCQGY